MKMMKNIVAVVVCSLLIGCTPGFEDLQKSPNMPERWEIAPITLLQEILYQASYDMLGHTLTINSELMQYSVNSNVSRYIIGANTNNSLWDGYYDILQDCDHMIQLAQLSDKSDVNLQAIGLTMKALIMSIITDIFGDVPCSEACKSRPWLPREAISLDQLCYETIAIPEYDTQKEIYEQIFSWLDEANTLYKPKQDLQTPERDLLYEGDIAKWKKFTNSLYVRLLMRCSNRNVELAVGDKLNAIVSDPATYPVFESNDDSAVFYYSEEVPFINRYAEVTTLNTKYCAKAIIDQMYQTYDPRTSCYFTKRGDQWNGVESGNVVTSTGKTGIAKLNKTSLASYTSPYAFMKYDELCLLMSEAAKRGLIMGGDELSKEYYEKGVTASVYYWFDIASKDKAETEAEKFLSGRGAYENTISQILTQQWVTNFWVGFESWCTYRRTGYPRLEIGKAVENDGFLPKRFNYATNSLTTNGTNAQKAIDRMFEEYGKGDTMNTPLWWSLDSAK